MLKKLLFVTLLAMSCAAHADWMTGIYNATPPTLYSGQNGIVQLDSSGNLNVNVKAGGSGGANNPTTIYSNQQTVTSTATALPTYALVNGAVVTADAANNGPICVGPSTTTISTCYKLQPGWSISYPVTNLNAIYVIESACTSCTASFTGN